MASSVLSGILKVDTETKKAILSMDATLQKIYKSDADKNKREIKQRKDDAQRQKIKEKEKNILEDILGELKKKDKDKDGKDKKGLWEKLFDAAGPALTGFFAKLFAVGGKIFAVVATALSGWKLGEFINNQVQTHIKPKAEALKETILKAFDRLTGGGVAQGLDTHTIRKLIGDKKSSYDRNTAAARAADNAKYGGAPAMAAAAAHTFATFKPMDPIAEKQQREDVAVLEKLDVSIRRRQALNDDLYSSREYLETSEDPRDKETYSKRVKKIEAEMADLEKEILKLYKSRRFQEELPIQKRQKGGPITIPGNSTGDSFPMMLPPGAFVMNRNASAMLQNGGLVPTLLEPGEKVFGPGDVSPMHHMLNSMIPRFQEGGMVSRKDTSKETVSNKGTSAILPGGGLPAVITTGQSLIKQGFTVAEHPNFIKGPPSKFDSSGKARVGGHSSGSLHYSGLALDVTDWRNGDWKGRTRQLAEDVYKQKDALKLTQIIHDPWGAWFKGESKPGRAIGGHPDHLHLGFGKGAGGAMGDSLNNDIASGSGAGESKPQSALDMMLGAVSGLGEVGKVISGVMGAFSNIAGGELMHALFGMGPANAAQGPGPTTGGDVGTSGISGSSQPLTGDMASKAKMMFDYAKSKGLSDAHAKGLIANMIRESSLRVDSPSGDDGGSGGLFQWKGGRGRRMAQAVPDWKTNWKGQMDYALIEPGEPGQQFKNSKFSSAEEAAYFWMDKWERPRDRAGGHEKHKKFISQMKFQEGGIVNMSSSQSPNTSRFKHAQEEFAQMIADKSGSPTIIVAGGGGGSQGPTVVSTPNAQSSVPSLPDGPSSIQAAEYFYRLNMGSAF